MTTLSAIVAALGTAAALGVWWLAHWLFSCLAADDRKDKGEFRD